MAKKPDKAIFKKSPDKVIIPRNKRMGNRLDAQKQAFMASKRTSKRPITLPKLKCLEKPEET